MSHVPLPDILTRILNRKREEVAAARLHTPVEALREQLADAPTLRPFIDALQQTAAAGNPAVIAEIKRASPSLGIIRTEFDPPAIAAQYERNGASALSVLTDNDFFQGDSAFLVAARTACSLPVIRKDFIIDEYQIVESRVLGADAVLLIVAALNDAQFKHLYTCARDLGMDVLIEVHDTHELKRALAVNSKMIGINNRNLRTFTTRLETTLELKKQVPAGITIVTESGIKNANDVARMRAAHIDCFLVGEAFMREPDPGVALKKLFF